MTVTNSNLNISQLSLQSLREESFSEVPLSEPPRLNASGKKYPTRRVASASHLPQSQQQQHSQQHPVTQTPSALISSRSSSNIIGLGIRKQNEPLSLESTVRKDRPFSNHSTASTMSDVSSFQEEINSRVSSISSYTSSPFVSPMMAEQEQQKKTAHVPSTPPRPSSVTASKSSPAVALTKDSKQHKLKQQAQDAKASSTPEVYKDLTPQQRYRLRRSQSKLTLKEIEKRYDEFNSDDEINDDTMVWNVPLAMGGAASFFANDSNCQSPKLVNKVLKSSSASMPPSELPGSLHRQNTLTDKMLPPSPALKKHNSFAQLSPEAKVLSSYYDKSTGDYIKNELSQRKSFSQVLPADAQQATELGFDDFKTFSEEKAAFFSSTRPIWLPPKSKDETRRHSKEVSKMFQNAAESDLQRKSIQLKQKAQIEICVARFKDINSKDHIRSKHVKECGTMLFESDMPREIEAELLTKIGLKTSLDAVTWESLELEYKFLLEKVASISFTSKTAEFNHIVQQLSKNYPVFANVKGKEYKELQKLMKLNQVTEFEMMPNLSAKFIVAGFSSQEIFKILRFCSSNSINELFTKKYCSNLLTNTILKRNISESFIKEELSTLSFKHILSVLPYDFTVKFVELLLCIPDYKLAYALLLTICKSYHFGFDSFKQLIQQGKELDMAGIASKFDFFEQLKLNYKKF